MPTFTQLIKPSMMHYRANLHHYMSSSFQVTDNFLSRSTVKVKYRQDRITFGVYHNTYSYRVILMRTNFRSIF